MRTRQSVAISGGLGCARSQTSVPTRRGVALLGELHDCNYPGPTSRNSNVNSNWRAHDQGLSTSRDAMTAPSSTACPPYRGLPPACRSSTLATTASGVQVAAIDGKGRREIGPRLPELRKLYNSHVVQYSEFRWKANYHHLEMMSA